MARPPLPIGTFGTITTKEVRPGVYRARTRFRDFDGVTREIEVCLSKCRTSRNQ